MADEDSQWLLAIISIGVAVTVIIFKFTPLPTMIQGGLAGETVFFIGLAVVLVLSFLVIGSLVACRKG